MAVNAASADGWSGVMGDYFVDSNIAAEFVKNNPRPHPTLVNDLVAQVGSENVDPRPTGIFVRDYLRVHVGRSLPDEVIALYGPLRPRRQKAASSSSIRLCSTRDRIKGGL